jgi:two-component system cell cycle sensor histidine kinase/response regulator CckA
MSESTKQWALYSDAPGDRGFGLDELPGDHYQAHADATRRNLAHEVERLTAELARADEALAAERERRHRAEEAHRAAEARARQEQKLAALGRLAAGIAHDFNNVLMVVSASSEMVLGEVDADHPVRARIADVQRAAEHGAALTRRFLSFCRPAAAEPRVVDVNATVADTSAMLARIVGADVELLVRHEADPCPVRIGAGQLDHILVNLVVNARDAMPQGGRIVVETHAIEAAGPIAGVDVDLAPGRYITMSVSDTGCGMDPATLDRIFDAFFTTKATGQGTGLGLSTVHALVREAGGAVQVTSEPGRGTTFTVVLPRSEEEADREASAPREGRPSGAGTVLLYERDAAVRAVLNEILSMAGYEVLVAGERHEVARICCDAARRIDLIVADATTPRPGSRPAADVARALRPGVPAVLLTDDPDLEVGEIDRTAKTVAVAKPVGINALLQRVQEALGAGPES